MASANDMMAVNNFPVDDDNATTFPDDDEAGEVNDVFANTIKWREVVQNVWLRVEYLIDVNTQFGPAVIVGLLKRDGETIKAWTTTIIGTALTEKEKKKEKQKHVYKEHRKNTIKKQEKLLL